MLIGRCVDASGYGETAKLVVGKYYKLREDNNYYYISPNLDGWWKKRFEIVDNKIIKILYE